MRLMVEDTRNPNKAVKMLVTVTTVANSMLYCVKNKSSEIIGTLLQQD